MNLHRRHILLVLTYTIVMLVLSVSFNLNWYQFLRQMQVFEFFVLALATYRFTRLIVHDQIMEFLREAIYIKRESVDVETGEITVAYILPTEGFRLLCHELLTCESCVVVWVATLVTLCYITFPALSLILLIFAIAGTVSLGQTILEKAGHRA